MTPEISLAGLAPYERKLEVKNKLRELSDILGRACFNTTSIIETTSQTINLAQKENHLEAELKSRIANYLEFYEVDENKKKYIGDYEKISWAKNLIIDILDATSSDR